MLDPDRNPAPEGVRTSLKRSSRLPAIAVALLVVVGAFLAWRFLSRRAEPPPPPPPAADAPSAEGEAAAAEGPAPAPSTTEGLLEAVSKDALLRKALA